MSLFFPKVQHRFHLLLRFPLVSAIQYRSHLDPYFRPEIVLAQRASTTKPYETIKCAKAVRSWFWLGLRTLSVSPNNIYGTLVPNWIASCILKESCLVWLSTQANYHYKIRFEHIDSGVSNMSALYDVTNDNTKTWKRSQGAMSWVREERLGPYGWRVRLVVRELWLFFCEIITTSSPSKKLTTNKKGTQPERNAGVGKTSWFTC